MAFQYDHRKSCARSSPSHVLAQSGGYRPLFLTATRLNVRANKVLLQSRQEGLKEVWLNFGESLGWKQPLLFSRAGGARLPQERFRGQPVVVVLDAINTPS